MATVLINGAEFLHVPKTGGNWVEQTLRQNNLVKCRVGHKHDDYDRNVLKFPTTISGHLKEAANIAFAKIHKKMGNVPYSERQTVFRFCFVRHPLKWYESWFKYMNRTNWREYGNENSEYDWHPNAILNGLRSASFNSFVRKVIDKRPGFVSELYSSYTKSGISFVGKTETLREDLAKVLDLMELPYDISTLLDSKKLNTSPAKPDEIKWDANLKEVVMRLELPALLRFGYLSEEEYDRLGIASQKRAA